MLLSLPVFVAQAAGPTLPLEDQPNFTFVNDESGPDDQPGQKDLSAHAVATPNLSDLWVAWKWDVTSLSGGNTGDACALFDTDADAKVNYSVCVTIESAPASQATTSPRVYSCSDTKVATCPGSVQAQNIATVCGVGTSTDPFAAVTSHKKTEKPSSGGDPTNDTLAVCKIATADFGASAGTAKLINTCSYPSQSPTSDYSDCVLVPRDAFVRVTKITDVATSAVFDFSLGVQGDTATVPAAFDNVAGAVSPGTTTAYVAIRSDAKYDLTEVNLPLGWAIDGAPSCTGTSGTGSSNGTGSAANMNVTGIDASSDDQVSCTFKDKRQLGAIRIVKVKAGTSTGLAGAHFQVDGAGDYTTDANGVACAAGLTFGSHDVTETQAPNGYSRPQTTTQSKNVAAAGSCPSNPSVTATFEDALVPGTLTITKTGIGGGPLAGATFTLYNDAGTIGGTREAATIDTITNPALACTTVGGTCTIANIPLGEYWIVETAAPNGYTFAADRHLTIDVGGAPGVGDVEDRTISDTAKLGSVLLHKVGRGLPLQGAVFTLYTRTGLETTHSPGAGTALSCTSDQSGDCLIENVPLGDYWVVETTTPAGYATVDDIAITVGLGGSPNVGATVERTVTDPTVPGSIVVNKTGYGGATLNGATFSLYVDTDPSDAVRSVSADPLTSPLKSCSTVGAGTCTISDVPLGDYWLVETGVPNGYDAAPEQKVHVGLGGSSNQGDTDTFNLSDPVVNGTVSIAKTDDANNNLTGAVFKLYNDAGTIGGTREAGTIDTITNPLLSCMTGSGGTCDINSVPPGHYWIVETAAPNSHYELAADKAIEVEIGGAPHVGDTVEESFVDKRKHRVVVIVCHEGTDTLFSRDVKVDGVRKASIAPGSLSGTAQKALCDTGGASFGDIAGHDHVDADIDLGTLTP